MCALAHNEDDRNDREGKSCRREQVVKNVHVFERIHIFPKKVIISIAWHNYFI